MTKTLVLCLFSVLKGKSNCWVTLVAFKIKYLISLCSIKVFDSGTTGMNINGGGWMEWMRRNGLEICLSAEWSCTSVSCTTCWAAKCTEPARIERILHELFGWEQLILHKMVINQRLVDKRTTHRSLSTIALSPLRAPSATRSRFSSRPLSFFEEWRATLHLNQAAIVCAAIDWLIGWLMLFEQYLHVMSSGC